MINVHYFRNIFVENLYKDKLMAPPEYAVLDAWYKWLIGNVEIESDLISKYKKKKLLIFNFL